MLMSCVLGARHARECGGKVGALLTVAPMTHVLAMRPLPPVLADNQMLRSTSAARRPPAQLWRRWDRRRVHVLVCAARPRLAYPISCSRLLGNNKAAAVPALLSGDRE